MNWDSFFFELEGQLDDERALEQSALDGESERLRIAHLRLATRLRTACVDSPVVRLTMAGEYRTSGTLVAVGTDWCALEKEQAVREFISIDALRDVTMNAENLSRSIMTVPSSSLAERVTWGFVMRELARRRAYVSLRLADNATAAGTIDRASADHLDFAHHEKGTPRRASNVRSVSIVPYQAMLTVSVEGESLPPFVGGR